MAPSESQLDQTPYKGFKRKSIRMFNENKEDPNKQNELKENTNN